MADTKTTDLTEATSLADTDLVMVVTDPGGSPLNQKITKANLLAGFGGSINRAVVVKSANESVTSSTAFQDDDELTFAIGVSETWKVRLVLFLDGSTAGDVKFALSAPTGATGWFSGYRLQTGGSSPTDTIGTSAGQDFGDTNARSGGLAGVGTYVMITLEALVINSTTAGSVTLRWAQVSSSGTATTVYAGSYLVADEMTAGSGGNTIDNTICAGRLTTESGVPVSTSDRTSQSTIYFTPYKGNRIALYTGSAWALSTFSELSLALSSLTSGKNYDVFVDYNSGTPQLVLSAAWSSDTARTDALALQDGVYVKSGTTTYRYVGTIRTTSTSTTEDSAAKRFVWNAYNQVIRSLYAADTTASWNYTTNTWRQANGSSVNQVAYVAGLSEVVVSVIACASNSNTSASITTANGIGVDSTTTPSQVMGANSGGAGARTSHTCAYTGAPGLGYHYLAALEVSAATGTTTWKGQLTTLGGTTTDVQSIAGQLLG